jgi:hypothetical protein
MGTNFSLVKIRLPKFWSTFGGKNLNLKKLLEKNNNNKLKTIIIF